MTDIFLAHNTADLAAVEPIALRLRDEAHLRVFLAAWHLIPGEPWIPALEAVLRKSKVMVLFFGPNGTGRWQELEFLLAQRDALPVVSVLLPGGRPEDTARFGRELLVGRELAAEKENAGFEADEEWRALKQRHAAISADPAARPLEPEERHRFLADMATLRAESAPSLINVADHDWFARLVSLIHRNLDA